MAKASKHKVEAAEAVSAFSAPATPTCSNCSFSRGHGLALLCGLSLPPWVKRSERPVDNIVRPNDHCDLHTVI